MTGSAFALAFALLAAGGPDQAQIDQIGGQAEPGDFGGRQLGAPVRTVEAAEASPPGGPLPQLNTEPASAAGPDGQPQPTPFRRPVQLNDQSASAEAPANPFATQARNAAVDAVSGPDACDPANPGAGQNAVCADTIETRSAEFAPPPSAEDRLLSGSEPSGEDARAAARRLADGDVQNSSAAQAYVYTSGLTAQSRPDAQTVSPQTQQAIDAAAQLLGVLPAGAVVTTR